MQQQLKAVTVKVDVALSKASHAQDGEKFLLEEIENLGKSLKCKSFELFCCTLWFEPVKFIFYLFLQMCASTVPLMPDL
jgi:hypothetical protein